MDKPDSGSASRDRETVDPAGKSGRSDSTASAFQRLQEAAKRDQAMADSSAAAFKRLHEASIREGAAASALSAFERMAAVERNRFVDFARLAVDRNGSAIAALSKHVDEFGKRQQGWLEGMVTAQTRASGALEELLRTADAVQRRVQDFLPSESALESARKRAEEILNKRPPMWTERDQSLQGSIARAAAMYQGASAAWIPGYAQVDLSKVLGDAEGRLQQFARSIQRVQPGLEELLRVAQQSAEAISREDRADLVGSVAENSEVASEAQEIGQRLAAQVNEQPTLEAAIANLAVEVGRLRDSPVRNTVFKDYIYPLILALLMAAVASVIDFYVKRHLEATAATTPRQVKRETVASVGSPSVLADYRFVRAKQLAVRVNPRARSPVIGNLRFGQAVKVLRKEKAFALIEWSDAAGVCRIQGWVFSRYLSRFD